MLVHRGLETVVMMTNLFGDHGGGVLVHNKLCNKTVVNF
jgi:hypothetical protein